MNVKTIFARNGIYMNIDFSLQIYSTNQYSHSEMYIFEFLSKTILLLVKHDALWRVIMTSGESHFFEMKVIYSNAIWFANTGNKTEPYRFPLWLTWYVFELCLKLYQSITYIFLLFNMLIRWILNASIWRRFFLQCASYWRLLSAFQNTNVYPWFEILIFFFSVCSMVSRCFYLHDFTHTGK